MDNPTVLSEAQAPPGPSCSVWLRLRLPSPQAPSGPGLRRSAPRRLKALPTAELLSLQPGSGEPARRVFTPPRDSIITLSLAPSISKAFLQRQALF